MSHDRHSTLRGPVSHGQNRDHDGHGHVQGHEDVGSSAHGSHSHPEPSSPAIPVLARPNSVTRTRTDDRIVPNADSAASSHLPRPLNLPPFQRRGSQIPAHQAAEAAEMEPDGPNTIRINVLAPYIEQGPSRPRGYPVDKGMSVTRLKDALCAGKYGGMPCRRDKMKIIWKGRLLEDGETLGSIVGPATPDQVHSFILIAVSPHHIYTPTPLDGDSTGAGKGYFTRRAPGGPGLTRPSTPSFGRFSPQIPQSPLPDYQSPVDWSMPETASSYRTYMTHAIAASGSTVNTSFDTNTQAPNTASTYIMTGTTARLVAADRQADAEASERAAFEANDPGHAATLQAVADSTHFMLFLARHHLFRFLGKDVLQWEDTYPRPVLTFAEAQQAVKGIVTMLVLAAEGLVALGAFADVQRIFGGVEYDGENLQLEAEEALRMVWQQTTGKVWDDTPGTVNEVEVEVDFSTQKLRVPHMASLSPAQRFHLSQYLRIARLLPLLNLLLARIAARPPTKVPAAGVAAQQPTPTVTAPVPQTAAAHADIPAAPAAPARRRRVYQLRVHLSLPLLKHALTSLVQIAGMVWMLTPRMKWSDTRFWIIAFGAMGWWVGDVRRVQVREARARARTRERDEAERMAREPVPAAAAEAPGAEGQAQAQVAVDPVVAGRTDALPAAQLQADAPIHARAAAAAGPAAVGMNNATMPNPVDTLAHLHLETDSLFLKLPTTPSGAAQPVTTRPRSRPSRIITQFLLPIYLFVITLVPALEEARAQAIRRRERAMRVIIGELNPIASADAQAAGVEGDVQATAEAREPALPQGLDELGRLYYKRVIEKGEGIDWEEEREAQRAAEAEFGGGNGGDGW